MVFIEQVEQVFQNASPTLFEKVIFYFEISNFKNSLFKRPVNEWKAMRIGMRMFAMRLTQRKSMTWSKRFATQSTPCRLKSWVLSVKGFLLFEYFGVIRSSNGTYVNFKNNSFDPCYQRRTDLRQWSNRHHWLDFHADHSPLLNGNSNRTDYSRQVDSVLAKKVQSHSSHHQGLSLSRGSNQSTVRGQGACRSGTWEWQFDQGRQFGPETLGRSVEATTVLEIQSSRSDLKA